MTCQNHYTVSHERHRAILKSIRVLRHFTVQERKRFEETARPSWENEALIQYVRKRWLPTGHISDPGALLLPAMLEIAKTTRAEGRISSDLRVVMRKQATIEYIVKAAFVLAEKEERILGN